MGPAIMDSTIESDVEVITPAAPLSTEEENSLLVMAVANDKVGKVKTLGSARESRAWSLIGQVD